MAIFMQTTQNFTISELFDSKICSKIKENKRNQTTFMNFQTKVQTKRNKRRLNDVCSFAFASLVKKRYF